MLFVRQMTGIGVLLALGFFALWLGFPPQRLRWRYTLVFNRQKSRPIVPLEENFHPAVTCLPQEIDVLIPAERLENPSDAVCLF